MKITLRILFVCSKNNVLTIKNGKKVPIQKSAFLEKPVVNFREFPSHSFFLFPSFFIVSNTSFFPLFIFAWLVIKPFTLKLLSITRLFSCLLETWHSKLPPEHLLSSHFFFFFFISPELSITWGYNWYRYYKNTVIIIIYFSAIFFKSLKSLWILNKNFRITYTPL